MISHQSLLLSTIVLKGAVHLYCLQWEAVQARMILQPVKSLK